MKSKILSTIIAIAMISFAFNAKASTVTLNPGIESIAFYPTQGGDPIIITGSGDVPDGIYTAVVQVAGSFAIFGHVDRSWYEVSGYDPITSQPVFSHYGDTVYPDNDPYSPTFGQATFYSVSVNSYANNTFSMGY